MVSDPTTKELIMDWQSNDFIPLHRCGACGKPYPTRREADLCTPEYLIAERYGAAS